jgi:hypothetical protein
VILAGKNQRKQSDKDRMGVPGGRKWVKYELRKNKIEPDKPDIF